MLSVVQAIQGDSEGNVNILAGDNNSRCENKYLVKNTEVL
jgi:hypothetical protein